MNAHADGYSAVRVLRPLHPMTWLERAWHDIRLVPGVSFGHGLLLALLGWVLILVARDRFWVMAGALSGFLLVAPVLATGLYAISRDIGRGEPVGWFTVRRVWRSLDRRLVVFGLLLAAAGTCWVMTSAALITLLSKHPIHTPIDFLRYVVADQHSWLFELWLAMGSLLAVPVYASSVIAIPLMLDKPVGVLEAVLASWRAVLDQPAAMAVWAGLLMGFTLLGIGSVLVGLVFVIPMLGHASWYAYRDLMPSA